MREQTKAIKEILKEKFPSDKFKLKYIEVNNYIDTSDKIILTCDRGFNTDDVIKVLNEYTYGIKIYKQGDVVSVWRDVEGKIYYLDKKEYVLAEMLEFIEVRSSNLSFELIRKMNKSKRNRL